jgi:hypothetical protein
MPTQLTRALSWGGCTCSSLSMKAFLSPENLAFGPPSNLDARPRSSRTEERQRAKTASPIKVTGCPRSRALIAVHFPVPYCQRFPFRKERGETFCPAESMILVTRGTPSSSLNLRISVVISIKNESNTPLFQRANTSAISPSDIPTPRFIMSYAYIISPRSNCGREPQKSIACHHIRCRCGPS